MKTSLCKHGFPIQPPHGSIIHPGPCTGCGITYLQHLQELERQAEARRLATAHEGHCDWCKKTRMLFAYDREEQPWEETAPPTLWLCMTDWGTARTNEEESGFTDFNDLFDRGSDEQLQRGLRGSR